MCPLKLVPLVEIWLLQGHLWAIYNVTRGIMLCLVERANTTSLSVLQAEKPARLGGPQNGELDGHWLVQHSNDI